MITLTQAAIGHIERMMADRDDVVGFRLSVKETGCSGYMYVPSLIKTVDNNDIEVDVESPTLRVFLDPEAVPFVKGTELDFVKKTLGMEQLVYDNPNTDSLCGCGESFNLKGAG